HEEAQELLAAFALDALAASDQADLAAHLRQCDPCRQSLVALLPVASALALAPAAGAAPAALRERLTAAVKGVPAPASALPQRAQRWRRRQGAAGSLAGWLAAAALFLVSLSLGGWGVWEHSLLQAGVSAPLAATASGDGARGAVAAMPDHELTLYVTHLPPPPTGHVYAAWVVHAGVPHASGIFVTSAVGTGGLVLTARPVSGDQIVVTRELAPGQARPTGPALLQGVVAA
ncbi:MAG TPA: anti-sigma factor, partial [Chloroflexota bacterium]|nr:anti-sigma factor [Chloroflexota bacterium]